MGPDAAADGDANDAAGATGSGGSTGNGGATGSGCAPSGGATGSAGGTGCGGDTGSYGGTGAVCGGLLGRTCSALQWCDFPGGTCGAGDQQGQCRSPETCNNPTDCSNVVCGCDGNSYCNVYLAHLRGLDTTGSRSCIPGNGGAGIPCAADTDCLTGFKCCRACGALDCPIACTQVATVGQRPALP